MSVWVSRVIRCCVLAGAAVAGASGGVGAQSTLSTEIRLAADPAAPERKKLDKNDEKAFQTVLEKRLPILVAKGGKVEVRSADDILVRVPLEKVLEPQLRMFGRPGLLEFRNLENVHTSLNRKGRYLLDRVQIQRTFTIRFLERESGRVVSAADFLPRCPLLLDNRDMIPESARVVTNTFLAVRVQVTRDAGRRLERFTSRPGRLLAVALDREIIGIHALTKDAVRAEEKSKDRKAHMDLDITGGFATDVEAGYLTTVFNSGTLPCPLVVASTKLVGE